MNREEAIEILQEEHNYCLDPAYVLKAIDLAITALRGPTREQELVSENTELKERIVNWRKYMAPTREQVEKVWRGEWGHTHSSDNFWTEVWKCSHCDFEDNYGDCFDFCPFCGRAMTDKAVEMVMERLEALYEKID